MNRRSFFATIPLLSQFRFFRVEHEEEVIPVSVVRYPYIQNVRGNQATIMWAASRPGFGEVEYSSDGVNFRLAQAVTETFVSSQTNLPYAFTQYEAVLNGLEPDTTYIYRAFVDGQPVNLGTEGRFRTASNGNGAFAFLVFGDSGMGTQEQFNVAARMTAERNISFVIHTGDIAYFNGTYSQFQSWYFDFYQSLKTSLPVFATPGNHDCEIAQGKAYVSLFSFPTENVPVADRNRYYSFDWGNAHFVSLDSSVALNIAVNGGGAMLRWLENDLRSTRKFWRIAIMHHPPYAVGPNDRDVLSALVRTRVVPILEAHGVQFVLTGHEHSFQRSRPIRGGRVVQENRGTYYFTSGGGGAHLYSVDFPNSPNLSFMGFGLSEHHYLRVELRGTQMAIRAFRQNGLELDRFSIAPLPIPAADETSPAPVTFYPIPGGGTLVRITGHSLAIEETIASSTYPGPLEMAGTFVTINGQRLPLYYASHDQIYAELPAGLSGRITLRIANPNGFAETVADIP
ncbi:MAG: metallophosphoesterase [Acidobacteria bacterium]|nr:metallophosphoesterase [Acidobacteriota bacterium]